MIGQLCIKFILASSERFCESAVQISDKLFLSSHEADEVGHIVGHVPTINPAIVLSIIFTGSHTSGITVVERFDPVSFFIFRMEESCLFIVEIPIVIRTFQIILGFLFFI